MEEFRFEIQDILVRNFWQNSCVSNSKSDSMHFNHEGYTLYNLLNYMRADEYPNWPDLLLSQILDDTSHTLSTSVIIEIHGHITHPPGMLSKQRGGSQHECGQYLWVLLYCQKCTVCTTCPHCSLAQGDSKWTQH